MWIIKLDSLYWSGTRWVHRQPEALRFTTPPDLTKQAFPEPRLVELEALQPKLTDTSSGGDGHNREREH
jgi:hypothetical protein